MNLPSILLWGLVATIAQTMLEAGALWLGLSRMSLPFMLGTMFTADRDRAMVLGLGTHVVTGWLFAILYALLFESIGRTGLLLGAAFGLAHAGFILLVLVPLLPAVHPRMASERDGPDVTGGLEPPGPLALHYGRWTPGAAILTHLVYGGIIGSFYALA